MKRLIWSAHAGSDFAEALAYRSARDALWAEQFGRTVHETIEALRQINTGRPGRVARTLEKSVPRYPYIILFEIDGDALHILRVVHMARDWPGGLPPAE